MHVSNVKSHKVGADGGAVDGQVLEVVAETTAPLVAYEELLSAAPSDESQADKLERLRAAAEAQQQIEAAEQQVRAL